MSAKTPEGHGLWLYGSYYRGLIGSYVRTVHKDHGPDASHGMLAQKVIRNRQA